VDQARHQCHDRRQPQLDQHHLPHPAAIAPIRRCASLVRRRRKCRLSASLVSPASRC
jgi:hypothetical protein